MNIRRRILLGTISIVLFAVIGFTYWAYTPLGPTQTALDSLIDNKNVSVTETNRITFTPKTTPDAGFILYPGGHVDPRSYSSIADQIADKGYLVVIPKMPFNLAVFNKRAAVKIIDDYPEIDNWAIGGHSLGGAMAASLIYDEPEMFEGLVLLAAYPPKNSNISSLDLIVTIVYGSHDEIATQSEIEESFSLLPFETERVLIEGGNHAQFGDYGAQNGDGIATIESGEQQKIVIQAIVDTLKGIHTHTEGSNQSSMQTVDTVVDIDGNIYKTVKIGDQIWMAENLKTTKLNDGQSILYEPDNSDWTNLRIPGYCWPNNEDLNKDEYGALYNWYAVDTEKLAPIGWHVPTYDEWEILADYLGGISVAGGRLKEINFTVSFAGQRIHDGSFNFLGEVEKYWTVTERNGHPGDVWYYIISRLESELARSSHQKMDGHSVRCVKDY